MNHTVLIGNLTRDPELRALPGGNTVCEFSVAVNERRKDGEDRVDYFDVTAFGRVAETCGQYLAKGSKVAVDGRLRQDRWQNDQGQNRSKVKVVAQFVEFLTPRPDGGDQEFDAARRAAAEARAEPGEQRSLVDDEIPF
jgi:single-strand DNA-binding protein